MKYPAKIGTAGICGILTLFSSPALAKPRSVQVDAAFDECQWAAEVRVLAVRDTIRVQVTENADAIFRGHQLMGRVIDVQPCRGGPTTCSDDLTHVADGRTRTLMVVSAAGDIALVGQPQLIDGKRGYHLRTWCDWNAVWFYSKDEAFGQPVGERFEGNYAVTTQQIAARFAEERQALMSALAEIFVRPRVYLAEERVTATIAQLGHEEFYVREAAQRRLTSLGEDAVPLLQERARLAKDPEVAARLRATIRDLQTPLQRHAQRIRQRGAKHEAEVLLEAHDDTSKDTIRAAILFRLQTLAQQTSPQKELEFSSNQAVLQFWRGRVQ